MITLPKACLHFIFVYVLTNDISDIYLTLLSANQLFDQRSYGIGRYAAASQ